MKKIISFFFLGIASASYAQHAGIPRMVNVDGLLLCWYFIMSRPEPQPIEKLMMKITTNAE